MLGSMWKGFLKMFNWPAVGAVAALAVLIVLIYYKVL